MSIYLRGEIWWAYLCRNGRKVRVSLRTSDMDEARTREAALAAELPPSIKLEEPWKFDGAWINQRIGVMRYRAKARGLPCMTKDDLRAMVARSGGRCELSGIPFTAETLQGCKRAPYAPSIDRIDPRLGYTVENCRVVCFALNVALNQWGDAAFRRMAVGFLCHKPSHSESQAIVSHGTT